MGENSYVMRLRPRVTEFRGEVNLKQPPNTPEESEESEESIQEEDSLPWAMEEVIRLTPTPPPPEEALWLLIFRAFRACFPFAAVMHWMLTLAVLLLFNSALFIHEWRTISVDRLALFFLWRNGRIQLSVLNLTIAFSRRQCIYWECFEPAAAEVKGPGILETPGCHSLYAELRALPNEGDHKTLMSFMAVQMVFGPLALILAAAALVILGFVAFSSARRTSLLRVNVLVRVINSIFCLVFLIFALVTDEMFFEDDPAFPVPWPPAVRKRSRVSFWRPAVLDWFCGMTLQFAAIVLDIRRVRSIESEASSSLKRSRDAAEPRGLEGSSV